MNTELEAWQARLSLHFATLRESRRANSIPEPLFALEHGLGQTEVSDLDRAVRIHIASRTPSRDHWLVWVVYSAEFGYRYSGDEYWQTFEQETPGWIVNGDRYRIRDFYRRFEQEFGGAVPSGPWAEHFSIICWPITHAILPKDLQVQLARTLYESRYLLSEDVLGSTERLGDLIAARSWNASSRFQNFAQDKRLLGQIAAALLIQERVGSDELIYPPALQRISEDLEQERQAREWLRKARRSINERVQIRGLGSLNNRTSLSNISKLDEARSAVAVLGIEPRLVLRPADPSGTSWGVLLEIPGLFHLSLRFPHTREILTGSRCFVAGSQGRPLARGRLLHGAQHVRLVTWPKPDEVLLQFENRDSQLDFLLRTECLLRPGSTWLLWIASDGLAYERRGLRVKPGERYIILSTDGPLSGDGHATPIDVECDGVYAAILDLPESLTEDWQQSIQNLGLGQVRGIEVWPAGLSAVAWDGDGHGEWLASERPCLAILADHPLESLNVSIDSSPPDVFELAALDQGEPLYLELPQLPVGTHMLQFSAISKLAGETEFLDEQQATIRILEDRPQTSIAEQRGPMSIQIDPPNATMEQLWDGEVEILLRGPQDREVACRVSLLERNGGVAVLSKNLPPLNLPVSPENWRFHFDQYFRRRDDARDVYDTANVCVLEFGAGEIGDLSLQFERPFFPLRWALRREGKRHVVRLYDDSGHTEQPTITRAAFETPCDEQEVQLEPEIHVPDPGGMYIARTQSNVAAIIAPPVLPPGSGFSALGLNPEIERWVHSPDSAIRIVKIAELWSRARLPGDLIAAFRRQKVMETLTRELFRILCGENWIKAEDKASAGSRDAEGLQDLAGAISKNPTVLPAGTKILHSARDMANENCNKQVDFLLSVAMESRLLPETMRRTALNQRRSVAIAAQRWLVELALRVASDPAGAQLWAGPHLRTGLVQLMESPALARAARLAVLATDSHASPDSISGILYSGWRWA